MKAKDYFDKFYPLLQESTEENCYLVARDLFTSMMEEAAAMIISRKVQTGRGERAVVKEQNQKWNAIAKILSHSDCKYTLRRNGFQEMYNEL